MRMTLDDTNERLELLPKALERPCEEVRHLQGELDALDAAIGEHYHEHPHHGWTVRPDQGGEVLRQLQERREAVRRALVAARHEAGLPVPVAGAMWLINQAPAGYLG
jgi:hypothetical protein